MLTYAKQIVRGFIPEKKSHGFIMGALAIAMTYSGYMIFLKDPPVATIYSESLYPKEVARGDYFFISADVSFDQDCEISARRIIVGSDGVEYITNEEEKQVIKGQRMAYYIRVPIDASIPYGQAKFKSENIYRCDFWSRWIRPRIGMGRERIFNVVPAVNGTPQLQGVPLLNVDPARFEMNGCTLPNQPGYIVVKAHYRKQSRKLANLN